jgi:hypothetical protein
MSSGGLDSNVIDFRAKFTGVPQSLSKPPQRIAGSGFEIDSYPHPGKLETKHLRSLEFINKFHWWPYRMTPATSILVIERCLKSFLHVFQTH